MARDSVIMLSGGLDSVVLAYDLVRSGKMLRAIHLNVGQLSEDQELNAAKRIAFLLDLPLELVDLSGVQTLFRGFMSVDDARRGEADVVCPTEITPALIAVCVFHAQLTGAGELYTGLIQNQARPRPKLRQSLDALTEATYLFDPKHPRVTIQTPFLTKSKADVIRVGAQLGVPFEDAWVCRNDSFVHCGSCRGCTERRQGFQEAGIADPVVFKS